MALVSARLHLLFLNECPQTSLQLNFAYDAHASAGNRETEVHEVVEGEADCVALLALDFVHQLSCENLGDDRVFSFQVVVPPLVGLLLPGQIIEIHFFIWSFGFHFVEFFAQSV